LSQTKTNALVMIEDGKTPLPDGPDSATRLARGAQAQLHAGNVDAAISQYAAALLLRPDNLDTQVALGDIFRTAERWQDAKPFFTSLLNDHPDDPWIRYNLALTQRALGDRQAARDTLKPIVAGLPVVRIMHTNVPGKKAMITATQGTVMTTKGIATS